MENLETRGFVRLTDDELQSTDGGVLPLIGILLAAYALLREIVRDKGRTDGGR